MNETGPMKVSNRLSRLSAPKAVGLERLLSAAADGASGVRDMIDRGLQLADRLGTVGNIQLLENPL